MVKPSQERAEFANEVGRVTAKRMKGEGCYVAVRDLLWNSCRGREG